MEEEFDRAERIHAEEFENICLWLFDEVEAEILMCKVERAKSMILPESGHDLSLTRFG